MPKAFKIIHNAAAVLKWGIFAAAILRIAFKWSSLPEMIGVHFASDGTFDVTAEKYYAFYPYVITLVTLLLSWAGAFAATKVKTGMKLSGKGDFIFRAAIVLLIDVVSLVLVVFFGGVWVDCVLRQHPLNTAIPSIALYVMFAAFAAFFIAAIVIRLTNPANKDNPDPERTQPE